MEEFLRKWGWQLLWWVTLAFLLPGILSLDFISMGVATAMVLYKGYNFRSLSNPQKTSWVLSLIYIGVGLFFILVAAFIFGNYSGPAGGLVVFASFLGSVVALFPSAIIHWYKTWRKAKISSLIPLITAVVTIVSCVILPPYIYGWYREHWFTSRYMSYQTAAEYVLKQQGQGYIKLPSNYRNLSQSDGKVEVLRKGNDVNVVFVYGGDDVFVYAPTGKILLPYYYQVGEMVRENWYHAYGD